MSAVLDLPDADWQLVTLSGTWARERHVHDRVLVPGRQSVGSLRGATGHEHSPFLAVRRAATTEDAGEAFAMSLVYSGNFLAEAEVDPFGTARLRIGIHPEAFAWRLEPGATFTTPEAVIAWSGDGLGALSEALHGLYRERLARGPWRDRPRPVVLNNWEATYFDFDHDRIVGIARRAKALGVELFVLDDGWFGRRDDDDSSLGDWVVDRRKLPGGIEALVRDVKGLGLQFGIWIEPEMVNADSDLFRGPPRLGDRGARPRADGEPAAARARLRAARGRGPHRGRADGGALERADRLRQVGHEPQHHRAVDGVGPGRPPGRVLPPLHPRRVRAVPAADRALPGHPVRVVRRRRRAVRRRAARLRPAGVDVATTPTRRSGWRSSGERRWRSRCRRWRAHVSAVPNHQTGRVTPLFTRAAVAMFGAFGYELDPTAMPDDEQAEVARQVAWYTERRELLQRGRFLRLRSPFEHGGNETAWMAVDDEGSRAVVGFYRVLARPLPVRRRIRLRGLDPAATYRVTTWMDTFAAPVATADRTRRRADGGGAGDRAARHGDPAERVVRRHTARARRLPGAPVRRRQALTRPRTISSGPRRCSSMQREANVRRQVRQLDQSREDR